MADIDGLFSVFEETSKPPKSSNDEKQSSSKSSTKDILKRHRNEDLSSHIEETKKLKMAISDELKSVAWMQINILTCY